MKFFSNIKIAHKLGALMGGFTTGFILIGVAYFLQLSLDFDQKTKEANALEYRKLIHRLGIQHLKMQKIDALMAVSPMTESMQTGLTQKHWQLRENINHLLTKIKALEIQPDAGHPSGSYAVASTTVGIEAALDAYDSIFEAISKNLQREEVNAVSSARHLGASDFETLRDSADTATPEVSLSSQLEAAGSQLDLELENALNAQASDSADLPQDRPTPVYNDTHFIQVLFGGLLFTVAIGAAVGMFFVYRSIAFPLAHIQNIIRKVNRGNLQARVGLRAGDELSDLGRAFNQLLDERIHSLEDQARENDRLNNSIITLIKALGIIAQKDLTVKVPVSSDITGTISDAVNLLTSETAKTLFQVKDISERVNAVSDLLQKQSEIVVKVADEERRFVIDTGRALEQSTKTMNNIAKNAETAKGMAEEAIVNTQRALSTVTESVSSIKTIRGTISETEKRIKRLGDRSQEITGIVNLINTIAERTHILALNASMHAASAGEAGKGFAVVAEEVQRLAENAREATSNISAMVNNIRVETSDTVSTMNRLIAEVAEGTIRAEKAGAQMAETEASTRRLVETVHNISESSISQAKFTTGVRNRAATIRKITEQTGKKLLEQKNYTENMKMFSQQLVEQVNIFTLPEWLSRSASDPESIVVNSKGNLPGPVVIDQETFIAAPLAEESTARWSKYE